MFTMGLPRKKLQSMAVDVFKAANQLNLKLHFQWKPRTDPVMVTVDLGS